MFTESQFAHLSRVAFSFVRNNADADDAVQNAMIKILTADLAGVEDLEAFAIQCVKFKALDILRIRKQKRETEIPEEFEIATKAESAEVDIDWITRCPDLTERQREIIVLIINGNNCSEVAAMLNLSKSTVSEHINRIRELTAPSRN